MTHDALSWALMYPPTVKFADVPVFAPNNTQMARSSTEHGEVAQGLHRRTSTSDDEPIWNEDHMTDQNENTDLPEISDREVADNVAERYRCLATAIFNEAEFLADSEMRNNDVQEMSNHHMPEFIAIRSDYVHILTNLISRGYVSHGVPQKGWD